MSQGLPDEPQLLCPLCPRVLKKPHKAKTLNGIRVCKRCRNGFANRRQGAYIIDALTWAIIVVVPLGYLEDRGSGVGVGPNPFLSLVGFGTPIGFFGSWILPLLFFCKDGFSGMSPGKRLMGVQVVDQNTRDPIGFKQSFKRNLVLLIPLAVLFVAFTMMKGRRWGDGWAKTTVIWRQYAYKTPFDPRGVLCTNCGYNLTGNVSGRCPECFTPALGPAPDVPVDLPPTGDGIETGG